MKVKLTLQSAIVSLIEALINFDGSQTNFAIANCDFEQDQCIFDGSISK